MKTIKFLTLLFIAAIVNFQLVSCGDDSDSSTENNPLIETLKSKCWYWSSKELNTYSYGYSEEYNAEWLYFTSESSGVLRWMWKDKDSDLGTSSDSGTNSFSYSISGNTIYIKTQNGTSKVLTYSGGCLMDGSSIIYTPRELSSSDYDIIRSAQQEEEKASIEHSIAQCVSYNYSLNWPIVTINVTSNLRQKIGKSTDFGVEFGFYDEYNQSELIYGQDGGSVSINIQGWSLWQSTYDELTQKINNGEQLSDSERELYKEVIKALEKEKRNAIDNFCGRVIVLIDYHKYIVDEFSL